MAQQPRRRSWCRTGYRPSLACCPCTHFSNHDTERYKILDVDSISADLSRNLERQRAELRALAKHATPNQNEQLELALLILSLERMLATHPQEQQECKSWINSALKLLMPETASLRMNDSLIRLGNFKALCRSRMQFLNNDTTLMDTFEFDRKN